MVVQRAYGTEIFNMLSGVGDRVVENRQNALRNEIANRSYARQLEQDDLVQQRWLQEQEFEKQKWNTQSELDRQKFEEDKRYHDLTAAGNVRSNAAKFAQTLHYYQEDDGTMLPARIDDHGNYTIANKGTFGPDFQPLDEMAKATIAAGGFSPDKMINDEEKYGARAGAVKSAQLRAEKASAYPGSAAMLNDAKAKIQEIKATPNLEEYVGGPGGFQGRATEKFPVSQGARKLVKDLTLLKAQLWTLARQGLKGAGPVTDYEGGRGEASISNIEMSLDAGDFQGALDEAEHAINRYLVVGEIETTGDGTLPPEAGTPGSDQYERWIDGEIAKRTSGPGAGVPGPGAAAEAAGGSSAPGAAVVAPEAAATAPAPPQVLTGDDMANAPEGAVAPAPAATAAPAAGGGSPLETIKPGRNGFQYRKARPGPDNDRNTWERVNAGATSAAPATTSSDRSLTVTNSAGTPAVTPPPRDPVVTPIPNSPPPRQPAPGGTPGAGTLGGIMPGPGGAPLPGGLVPPQGGGGGMPEAGGGPPPPGGMAGPDPAEAPPEPTPFDQIRIAAYDKGKQEIIKRAIDMQKTRGTEAAQQWAEARLRELRQRFGGIPQ